VVKKIVKKYKDFLWGSKEGKRKFAWVRWEKVCSLREKKGFRD